MADIRYEPVQAVRITMSCDCGLGHFTHTGRSTLIEPITHSHKCCGCGRLTQLTKTFPAIEHFTAAEMEVLIGT